MTLITFFVSSLFITDDTVLEDEAEEEAGDGPFILKFQNHNPTVTKK